MKKLLPMPGTERSFFIMAAAAPSADSHRDRG